MALLAKEITSLPKAKVVSAQGAQGLPEDELGLCLQRERLSIDLLNPTSKIRYIGSKDVYTCIVLYLYTETRHSVIHVDRYDVDMGLAQVLKQFATEKNVKAMLIGGTPESFEVPHQESASILERIIKQLFAAAELHHLTIHFEQQFVLNSNRTDAATFHYALFDDVVRLSRYICHRYFDQNVENSIIKQLNPEHFLTKKTRLNLTTIYQMFSFLWQAKYKTLFKQNAQLSEADSAFLFEGVTGFIKYLDEFVSIEAYQIYLNQRLVQEPTVMTQRSLATHFVIDVTTQTIHLIDRTVPTPAETYRDLRITSGTPRYVDCYDSEKNQYLYEQCDQVVLTGMHNVFRKLKSCQFSFDSIKLSYPIERREEMADDAVRLACRFGLAGPVKQPSRFQLFKSLEQMSNVYGEQAVTVHSVLQRLNELTGVKFLAKLRKSPSHVLDAIIILHPRVLRSVNLVELVSAIEHLPVLPKVDNLLLETIKKLKEAKVLYQLLELPNKSLAILVPAINTHDYGTPIATASRKC
jgi:hypothetical protein